MTFLIVLLLIPMLVLMAAQLGAFRGRAPADLGVQANGQLRPPSITRNSVSSQTDRHPGHVQAAYAAIEPLQLQARSDAEAIARLRAALVKDEAITVKLQTASYLHAEARTRWMGFVDDLEFVASAPDPQGWVRIDVRSASRLGREDFGVNRKRIEALRERL